VKNDVNAGNCSMKILLVAATHLEIEQFTRKVELNDQMQSKVSYLVTGVGAVQTTYSLTRHVERLMPDFIIGAGVGGGFSREIALGSVLQVRSEAFADLGVQESRGWTDLFDLGLAARNDPPFTDGRLQNPAAPMSIAAINAGGCTVNQVTTDPSRIDTIQKLYAPLVESMEGAALHYVCINEGIPFIHLRAISNLVGERDKQRWKMNEALENLSLSIEEAVSKLLSQQ
jgi:futalosine hydrolase